MRYLMSATLVLVMVLAQTKATFADDAIRDYFVFLTTGKSTQGIAKEVIAEKQKAHLDNFGKQAKLGALTAAGPCADPAKTIRGIVVINADSIKDAESKFESDPYVTEGFMKVELQQYKPTAGKLQLVTEVISMEESVIVVFTRSNKWPSDKKNDASVMEDVAKFSKEQFASGKLGFGAQFTDVTNNSSARAAVMIFRGKDLAAVKAVLDEFSLVRDGVVSYQAFPQYMAKGAIAD